MVKYLIKISTLLKKYYSKIKFQLMLYLKINTKQQKKHLYLRGTFNI